MNSNCITFNGAYVDFVRRFLERLWSGRASSKLTLEQIRGIAFTLPGVHVEKMDTSSNGLPGVTLSVRVHNQAMTRELGRFAVGFEHPVNMSIYDSFFKDMESGTKTPEKPKK